MLLPCGSAGKESTRNVGDLGSIPELGRSPGEGNSYPLQYYGLENSMVYIVHGVVKSRQIHMVHWITTKAEKKKKVQWRLSLQGHVSITYISTTLVKINGIHSILLFGHHQFNLCLEWLKNIILNPVCKDFFGNWYFTSNQERMIRNLTMEDQKQACFIYTQNNCIYNPRCGYVHSNTGGICFHGGHCIN